MLLATTRKRSVVLDREPRDCFFGRGGQAQASNDYRPLDSAGRSARLPPHYERSAVVTRRPASVVARVPAEIRKVSVSDNLIAGSTYAGCALTYRQTTAHEPK